jgi:PTH1 family peptidyl-tRNA hydrolase
LKLFCGLGNPGREYEGHRHNVGFRVVEQLARSFGLAVHQRKFDAHLWQGETAGNRVVLLQPQTFMNLSGRSFAAAARFYKVDPENALVIHDELDLPFARLQLKRGGGAAGHNGLRSIVEHWGADDFVRLRVGISKPEGLGAKERVSGHVLSNFSPDEEKDLGALLERSVEAATCWLTEGLSVAMNRFNRR